MSNSIKLLASVVAVLFGFASKNASIALKAIGVVAMLFVLVGITTYSPVAGALPLFGFAAVGVYAYIEARKAKDVVVGLIDSIAFWHEVMSEERPSLTKLVIHFTMRFGTVVNTANRMFSIKWLFFEYAARDAAEAHYEILRVNGIVTVKVVGNLAGNVTTVTIDSALLRALFEKRTTGDDEATAEDLVIADEIGRYYDTEVEIDAYEDPKVGGCDGDTIVLDTNRTWSRMTIFGANKVLDVSYVYLDSESLGLDRVKARCQQLSLDWRNCFVQYEAVEGCMVGNAEEQDSLDWDMSKWEMRD